jgi:hypothetical protein
MRSHFKAFLILLLLCSHAARADRSDSLIAPQIPTDLSTCLYYGQKSYSECDSLTDTDPTHAKHSSLARHIEAFAQQGVANGIRDGASDGIDVDIPLPNTNYSIQGIHLITGVRRLTQDEIDADPIRKSANRAKVEAGANGIWIYHHLELGPQIFAGFPNINTGVIGGTLFPAEIYIDQPAELDFIKWYPLSHPVTAETDAAELLKEIKPLLKQTVLDDVHLRELMSGKLLQIGESAQLTVRVGAGISLSWLSTLGQIVNHLAFIQLGGLFHPQLDCEKKIAPSHSTSIQRIDENTIKVIAESFHDSTCDLAATVGPEINVGPVLNIGFDVARVDPYYHFNFWENLGSFKVDERSPEGHELLGETMSFDIVKKLEKASQAAQPIAFENVNDLHGSGWSFQLLGLNYGESHGKSNMQETRYGRTGPQSTDVDLDQYRFEQPNYQSSIGLSNSPDGKTHSAWIHSQQTVKKPEQSTLLEFSRFASFLGHSTAQSDALQAELTRWSEKTTSSSTETDSSKSPGASHAELTFYIELDSVALGQFMRQNADEGAASLRKGWSDIGVDPNDKTHEALLTSVTNDFIKFSNLPNETKRAEKFVAVLKKHATDPYVIMAIVAASGGMDHVLTGARLQVTEKGQPERSEEFVFKGQVFSRTMGPIANSFPSGN